MDTELMLKQEYQGYSIVVIKCKSFDKYWYNGYVGIPSNHPLYEMEYIDKDFPDLDVHGGITFTNTLLGSVDVEGWFIGFDTAHNGDTSEVWTIEAVAIETLELAEQLIAMECTSNLSTWLNKLKLKLKLQQ